MENSPVIEFAPIEQELADLTSQLQQSFQVLDGLAQVQRQFEELAQTHQRFKEAIDKSNAGLATTNQFQQNFDRRLAELETSVKSRSQDTLKRVSQVQTEFSTADRALQQELSQQINQCKQEMEEQFSAISQLSEQHRDAVRSNTRELEARFMHELNTVTERVNQSGISSTYVEKLETALRNTRTALRTVEKQLSGIYTWLAIVTFVLIVLLALEIPTLFSNKP
jgi:uncharacterized phage infection (PIP) family protein YhgE